MNLLRLALLLLALALPTALRAKPLNVLVRQRLRRGRAMLRKLLLECCQFEFDRRGGLAGCQPHRHTDCAECQ